MKKILENVQMRNLIYLFGGFIIIIIILFIYNPWKNYQEIPKIKEEDEVITPNDGKIKYASIIEKYGKMQTYYYTYNYGEKVMKGYAIGGIYNNEFEDEEMARIQVRTSPDKIYEMIKNLQYTSIDANNYKYFVESSYFDSIERDTVELYDLVLTIENEKVTKIKIEMENNLTIIYGD